MIDPKQITNFNRTEAELQEFLLFTIVVAGKNSYQQAKKLDAFLGKGPTLANEIGLTPFERIRYMTEGGTKLDYLIYRLQFVKMGQYSRISKAFASVAQIQTNLSSITVGDLQAVPGIGPKTARFFLMHSRPNQRIATLDTHILKWLRAQGIPNVPKATPTGNRYLALEAKFLELCDLAGKTPADMDLEIWKSSMKSPKVVDAK